MKIGSIRHSKKWIVVLVPAFALTALTIRAYVPVRWGAAGVLGAWKSSRFPIAFGLNQDTASGAPNVSAGSDVPGAVRAALGSWQSIPSAAIRFAAPGTVPVADARSDGINLITMAETPANSQLLGGPFGAVSLTRIDYDAATGEITESDILLNPGYKFSTNLAFGTYDLQAVLTHELGHALGCDHAPILSDTMFYAVGSGEFYQRYLTADAIAFAGITYPHLARSGGTGSIYGRISALGKGIFGASVTAVNLETNWIYAALSEPDGSFDIKGAAPGRYAVFAEPLDGPATPSQLMVQDYYRGLSTSFPTVMTEEQTMGVDGASMELHVDLSVPAGSGGFNINRMGRGDPETGAGYLEAGPVAVNPGETVLLLVGGQDTWKVGSIDDVQVLGSGIEINRSRGTKILKGTSGAAIGMSVLLDIAPDAAPGARTLVLRQGGQVAVSTGGIIVVPRAPAARNLYFPYLRTEPDFYTGVALANFSDSIPATVRATARDPLGAVIWTESSRVPAGFTLPGRTQVALLERQIFNLPLETKLAGSMTIESDNPELQGFFLGGDLDGRVLDGANAFTRGYRQLFFMDVLQDAETATEIHLMNTTDVAVGVELRLADESGTSLQPAVNLTIPAWGKIGGTIEQLFGFSGRLHSGHVVATAGPDALAGFELVAQPEAVFGLNAQPVESAGPVLYAPQLAVGELGLHFETRLNLINAGNTTETAVISIFDEHGNPLAHDRTASLKPGGHFTVDVRTLFGLEQGQGYIKVAGSASAKLMGDILFGDGDPTAGPLGFGAALPLSGAGSGSFQFAHLAQGAGYYTGIAVLAPDGAKGKIEAFDGTGAAKGTFEFGLAPGQRFAALLADILPHTQGQVGGTVKVTSDLPVIGFELFGALDGRVLSAVPPQTLGK